MTVDIDNPAAGTLRAELTARLIGKGLTAPAVQAAFRAVPRHAFAPACVSLADGYADTIVVTKRDPAGKIMSSVSAPWVQAYAVEQAALRPGDRVFEVGSGGYQAALLAEVVGRTGHVVTLDIDADITAHARAALDRAATRTSRPSPATASTDIHPPRPMTLSSSRLKQPIFPRSGLTSSLPAEFSSCRCGCARSPAISPCTGAAITWPPPRRCNAASSRCEAPAATLPGGCRCAVTTSSCAWTT
jgi:Protein-L-isoaspartate(D-aspartate) O-methyltransferase (PCMT)